MAMKTLKWNNLILLPGKTVSALVRCGFPVAGELVMKTLFPRADHSRFERAVRDYLWHKYAEIVRWYEDSPCPTGHLTADAPIWVFLPEEGEKENNELLQSVRKESGNRPVRVITRENYRRCVSLPGQLIKRLERVDDGILSELLCHTLLFRQDGTYVDARRWESAKKGDPVHGFVFDTLAACISARLPIVDGDLSGILTHMAEGCIHSVRAKRNELDRMILQSCSLRATGFSME